MHGNLAKEFNKKINEMYKKICPSFSNTYNDSKTSTMYRFKSYERSKILELPTDFQNLPSLSNVIEKRKTTRSYSKKPITLQTLSQLLYYSAGIQDRKNVTNWEKTFRHYPSEGTCYPLEVYIIIDNNSVENLENGIYHYNVKGHHLEQIVDTQYAQKLLTDPIEARAGLSIVVTAIWERSFQKYEDFGYKLILIEAGHLAQNIQLVAEGLGLSYCSFVSFNQEKMDDLLDFTKRNNENTLYITSLGYKK